MQMVYLPKNSPPFLIPAVGSIGSQQPVQPVADSQLRCVNEQEEEDEDNEV